MKSRVLSLALLLASAASAAPAMAGYLTRAEVKHQNEVFQTYWADDFQWKFDELPLEGKVEKSRMPYAGYIYPDKTGGCANALSKYDRAFNYGRSSAASHERHDIAIHKDKVQKPGGLFGWRTVTRNETPDWAGHCNGWVCAAIRHAEPKKTVYRNGVAFTPADIKGLLAEMYVYNDTITLDSEEPSNVDAAALHVVLGNWLGRGKHPVGMDMAPGKEVWNYPIYGYTSAAAKRGDRRVEVRTNVGYVYMLNNEYHIAPKNNRYLRFHYMLYLDNEGRITGGDFMADSDRIDMLWAPKQLARSGSPGNRNGNPHVDTEKVLAMWRESADEETRLTWWNIDPTEADRIVVAEEEENAIEAPIVAEELVIDDEISEGETIDEATADVEAIDEAIEESFDTTEDTQADASEDRDDRGPIRSLLRNLRS